MNLDDLTLGEDIFSEKDVHDLLYKHGFTTNYAKHDFENGTDIVAIKEGKNFNIEFKKLEKRENGCYRYGGNVSGQVLICATPKGRAFFVVTPNTSMTKTARLIDMLDGSGDGE